MPLKVKNIVKYFLSLLLIIIISHKIGSKRTLKLGNNKYSKDSNFNSFMHMRRQKQLIYNAM